MYKQLPIFTPLGFKTTKLDPVCYKKLLDYYEEFHDQSLDEQGPMIGTHIISKTELYPAKMLFLPTPLVEIIVACLQEGLESWVNTSLVFQNFYGIREYYKGAVLQIHSDRIQTHIISAILNVNQKGTSKNKEWPLYIQDHYMRWHKILLSPGEVIYYESATLPHSRTDELQADSYANVFIHYKPVGWDDLNQERYKLYEEGKYLQGLLVPKKMMAKQRRMIKG